MCFSGYIKQYVSLMQGLPMKKAFIIFVILLIIGGIWYALTPEKTQPVITDMPTDEEQRALEESQLPPETVAESDMEDQSPENAEHD